jgi:hypothetical protein
LGVKVVKCRPEDVDFLFSTGKQYCDWTFGDFRIHMSAARSYDSVNRNLDKFKHTSINDLSSTDFEEIISTFKVRTKQRNTQVKSLASQMETAGKKGHLTKAILKEMNGVGDGLIQFLEEDVGLVIEPVNRGEQSDDMNTADGSDEAAESPHPSRSPISRMHRDDSDHSIESDPEVYSSEGMHDGMEHYSSEGMHDGMEQSCDDPSVIHCNLSNHQREGCLDYGLGGNAADSGAADDAVDDDDSVREIEKTRRQFQKVLKSCERALSRQLGKVEEGVTPMMGTLVDIISRMSLYTADQDEVRGTPATQRLNNLKRRVQFMETVVFRTQLVALKIFWTRITTTLESARTYISTVVDHKWGEVPRDEHGVVEPTRPPGGEQPPSTGGDPQQHQHQQQEHQHHHQMV